MTERPQHPFAAFRAAQDPPMKKADLARLLETTRASITRYEEKGRVPDKSLWPRIRERTGIKPSQLGDFEKLEAAE